MLFVHRRRVHLPTILARVVDARPPVVYVFGDGPGTDEEDPRRCAEVRELIEDASWPCPVKTRFATTRLGLNRNVVEGINDVFAHHERAIFLEDDAVPARSFFGFCDELLEYFAGDPDVAMISGVNPLDHWGDGSADYLFSTLGQAHAWAGWRRGWSGFAGALERWQDRAIQERIGELVGDEEIFAARRRLYDSLTRPDVYSWDYQWALARQAEGGLCVVPTKNLALHRGHDKLAGHVSRRVLLARLATLHEIDSSLRHAKDRAPDRTYDRLVFELGHDRLSPTSARHVADRLVERDRRLLAVAVLRHACAGAQPDAVTAALIRQLLQEQTTGEVSPKESATAADGL